MRYSKLNHMQFIKHTCIVQADWGGAEACERGKCSRLFVSTFKINGRWLALTSVEVM